MNNYQQRGLSMPAIAAAAVLAGSVVKVGALLGVATGDAQAGDEYQLNLQGVYLVPKVKSVAIAQGEPVTFVAASGLITNAAAVAVAGDVSGGAAAFEAAAVGADYVAVLFTGAPGTVKA